MRLTLLLSLLTSLGSPTRAPDETLASTVAAEAPVGLRKRPSDEEECTPGYDPCIPPGPDVDCAGGRGNGPRYVEGPVYVTGSDPYDLDRDGDGVGCE